MLWIKKKKLEESKNKWLNSQVTTLNTITDAVQSEQDEGFSASSILDNYSKLGAIQAQQEQAQAQAERTAQAKALQEETDQNAKAQKEIGDFQKNVHELTRKAGYPNDFFSEKFRFFSFYRNEISYVSTQFPEE